MKLNIPLLQKDNEVEQLAHLIEMKDSDHWSQVKEIRKKSILT